MWVVDLEVQKWRGFAQGYHRGLYKDYDWLMPEQCMDKNFVKQVFYIEDLFTGFDFARAIDMMGLFWNVYYNSDDECLIDAMLYDLSCFCFDHDCRGEKLLQNELGKVFQVTGALNSLAAIYYDEQPGEDEHSLWFEFYTEVGLNLGKIMRWTLAFDPRELHGLYHENTMNDRYKRLDKDRHEREDYDPMEDW